MPKSDLLLRVGLDPKALTDGFSKLNKDLKRFSFRATSVGRDLTTSLTLPILGAGAAAVKTFADFDRLEKGLAALNGSAEGGAKSFDRLNKIVLDTRTTLDLKTAALGAQRLQGAGLSATFAERTIKQLGIAATVSGSAIDDVGGVLRQFTQIIGKGKVEQEDLNSILDRMPALGALIKEEFGGVTAEAIRNTGISMEAFVSRLVGAIEQNEDFQNVQGGLAKSFESFGNAVAVGIRPLGEAISKSLNLEENLEKLGNFVTESAQAFADLNPNIQRFVVLGAAGAAAIGPLIFGLGTAAKLLPLLTSGVSILAGPLKVLGGAFSFVTSTASLFLTGGSIGRAVLMTKAIKGLSLSFAALTSPITLVVGGIAAIAGGFILAYKNSAFFRVQLDRLAQAFYPITEAIGRLSEKYFPELSISLSSIGGVFKTVFSAIAGGISFVIEAIISIVETAKLTADALGDLFDGNFSSAGEKFSRTLFNPEQFKLAAGRAAEAAVTTFNQSLSGDASPEAFGKLISPSLDLGGNGTELEGGGGGGGRSVPDAIREINFEATELSKGARKKVGEFFNEFVVGSSNVEFLQSRLSSLEVTPVVGLDRVERAKSVMQEVSKELREGVSTALAEADKKARFFGESFDVVSEKTGILKDALKTAYEEGLKPADEAVTEFNEGLNKLDQTAESTIGKFGEMSSSLKGLESTSIKAFDVVSKAMSEGESAAKAFGKAIVSSVRDAIAAEIKLAVAKQVASALSSVPFPFNVGLAAAAGAGASALFTSALNAVGIPALAEGGITTGPTLALIGEGKNNEAVIPLPKLDALIQKAGGGGQMSGGDVLFRIEGDSLVGVLNRAGSSYNRAF